MSRQRLLKQYGKLELIYSQDMKKIRLLWDKRTGNTILTEYSTVFFVIGDDVLNKHYSTCYNFGPFNKVVKTLGLN